MDSTGLGSAKVIILLLAFAILWTAARPYAGITHDAQLYTLQALAKLNPILSEDIFLRFGSQDAYSVFPGLYGFIAAAIGFEASAAWLTFFSSVLWLLMGWLIARAALGDRLAWLSLGLLIVTPAWYGAFEVFRAGEMFLSARLPAEVFALFAIVALLRGHTLASILLILIAGTIHPLMAAPVAALIAILVLSPNYGKLRTWQVAVAVTAIAGIGATLLTPAPPADQTHWFELLHARSRYIFPSYWRTTDWLTALLTLITLALSVRSALSEVATRLSRAAFWVGIAGLLLSLVAEAMTTKAGLLLIQPWRWMWIATFVAIVVSPATAIANWRCGGYSRLSAALLMCGWLTRDSVGGALALAAAAMHLAGPKIPRQHTRLLETGATMICLATIGAGALQAVHVALGNFDNLRDPIVVQRFIDVMGLTAAPIVLVALVWRVVGSERSAMRCAVWSAGLVAILAFMGPTLVRNWTDANYFASTYQRFGAWRSLIPESVEVLWPNQPLAVWLLLERKSYISPHQSAGLLYSPAMLSAFEQRAAALSDLADPRWWTLEEIRIEAQPKGDVSREALAEICRAPDLGFLVLETDVGNSSTSMTMQETLRDVYLYDCAAIRLEGTT